MVREFYANAHFNRLGNVVLVRSKDISFISATLRSILNLPTVANDDFHRLLHECEDYEALLQEMGNHVIYSLQCIAIQPAFFNQVAWKLLQMTIFNLDYIYTGKA